MEEQNQCLLIIKTVFKGKRKKGITEEITMFYIEEEIEGAILVKKNFKKYFHPFHQKLSRASLAFDRKLPPGKHWHPISSVIGS